MRTWPRSLTLGHHSPVTTPEPDDATPLRLCASQEKELVLFKPVEETNTRVEKNSPQKRVLVVFEFQSLSVDLSLHSFGELKKS